VQLIIIGTHQRMCPVNLREQLAFGPAQIRQALQVLSGYADEGFIISTCNRVEVGGLVASGQAGEAALLCFLANWHHVAPEELTPHLYTFADEEAVRHLFRLAAGLDSMVLGEDQIMVQLKATLADAQAAGTSGQRTNRLLHKALATGKLVRTRTEIARSRLSTVSVALDIARETLGDLGRRNVAIVGAGRIAELALKHLRGDAPGSVVLVNRTLERARDLASAYGAEAWQLARLEEALRHADVVISCTASPEVVIDAATVERARLGRGAMPLVLLDLAVPRDVDRRAAELPGVRLVDIDDMRAICEANRATRAAEVVRAEALVEGEVAKFNEWWKTQEVVPTIRALRERAETIRQAEIERTLAKLPDLSPREQEAIEALSAAIVNKLLHQPIATLKEPGASDQLAQAVQQLFQLNETSSEF
jgi:glutamyl-tRNA reductase